MAQVVIESLPIGLYFLWLLWLKRRHERKHLASEILRELRNYEEPSYSEHHSANGYDY